MRLSDKIYSWSMASHEILFAILSVKQFNILLSCSIPWILSISRRFGTTESAWTSFLHFWIFWFFIFLNFQWPYRAYISIFYCSSCRRLPLTAQIYFIFSETSKYFPHITWFAPALRGKEKLRIWWEDFIRISAVSVLRLSRYFGVFFHKESSSKIIILKTLKKIFFYRCFSHRHDQRYIFKFSRPSTAAMTFTKNSKNSSQIRWKY